MIKTNVVEIMTFTYPIKCFLWTILQCNAGRQCHGCVGTSDVNAKVDIASNTGWILAYMLKWY